MEDNIIYFNGESFSSTPDWDMDSFNGTEALAPLMDCLRKSERDIWIKATALSGVADTLDTLLSEAGLSGVEFEIYPSADSLLTASLEDMDGDDGAGGPREMSVSLADSRGRYIYIVTIHIYVKPVGTERIAVGSGVTISRCDQEDSGFPVQDWRLPEKKWVDVGSDRILRSMMEENGFSGMTGHQLEYYMEHMMEPAGELVSLVFPMYGVISDEDFDRMVRANEKILEFYSEVDDYGELVAAPLPGDGDSLPEPWQLQIAVVPAQENVTGTAVMYRNGHYILAQFVEPMEGLYDGPVFCRETAGIPEDDAGQAVKAFKEMAGMGSKYPVIRVPLSPEAFAVADYEAVTSNAFRCYTCGEQRELNRMENEALETFVSSLFENGDVS